MQPPLHHTTRFPPTPRTRDLARRTPHIQVPCMEGVWDTVGSAGMDMEDTE